VRSFVRGLYAVDQRFSKKRNQSNILWLHVQLRALTLLWDEDHSERFNGTSTQLVLAEDVAGADGSASYAYIKAMKATSRWF
jgi:hypothetical protein